MLDTANAAVCNIYYDKNIKIEPYPSSLFDGVQPSVIRTRRVAKWKSTKAFSDARNFLSVEMSLFLQQEYVQRYMRYLIEIFKQLTMNILDSV